MPSSIGWVVHDRDEDDRVHRLLAALRQSEARDELGFGGVRDSLADLLFPGTSTIQTRLRYFLIVPWCYRAIEGERVKAPKFGQEVGKLERRLIEPLLAGEDHAGAFGAQRGEQIKRLPSTVYWSGLQQWGIRRQRISRTQYHRQVDAYYLASGRRRTTDEGESIDPRPAMIWHPDLPPAPERFPAQLDLTVRAGEAQFLVDRLLEAQPTSLLTWLAQHDPAGRTPPDAPYPWAHPSFAAFPKPSLRILHHARLVSEVLWGAGLLYNVLLARLPAPSETRAQWQAARLEERIADLQRWREGGVLRLDELATWKLGELRTICESASGHNITASTWAFLSAWVERVRATAGHVESDPVAATLVQRREESLKGGTHGRSRFHNPTMRATWGGEAGIGRLTFRWPTVQVLLNDLAGAASGEAVA
jgi:hypothetical protein